MSTAGNIHCKFQSCRVFFTKNLFLRYHQLRYFKSLMYNGEVKPATAKYFVAEWKRELWVALHCLLSTKEGTRLGDTIDMFVTLAHYRLDMTDGNY